MGQICGYTRDMGSFLAEKYGMKNKFHKGEMIKSLGEDCSKIIYGIKIKFLLRKT